MAKKADLMAAVDALVATQNAQIQANADKATADANVMVALQGQSTAGAALGAVQSNMKTALDNLIAVATDMADDTVSEES